MLEHIRPFLLRLVLEFARVADEFEFAAREGEFGYAASGECVEVFAVPGRDEAARYALGEHAYAAFLEIPYAKVVTLLQPLGEVEFLAVRAEVVVAHHIGVRGQPAYAVVARVELKFKLLHAVLRLVEGVFLLLFLLCLYFLVALEQFGYAQVFLAAAEFGVGLRIEEHNENVALGAPAAVAAVAVLV